MSRRTTSRVEDLIAEGAIIVVICTAFPVGIWIHTTNLQLEVPGVIITTLLGLIASVLWLGSRSLRDRWVWGAISVELLCLCMTLAIFYGQSLLVEAVYALASVGYVAAGIVVSTRLRQRASQSLSREVERDAAPSSRSGEPMSWPAIEASLATDPHAIVVQPSKPKIAGMLALHIAVILGGGLAIVLQYWSPTDPVNPVLVGGLALFGMLGLIGLPARVRRILDPDPALCVFRNGIFDHCSLRASGAGFIPWEEITGSYVADLGGGVGIFSRRVVVIVVAHPAALIARQSAGKRWLLRQTAPLLRSPVNIPEAILSVKAGELEKQLRHYYQTYVAQAETGA